MAYEMSKEERARELGVSEIRERELRRERNQRARCPICQRYITRASSGRCAHCGTEWDNGQ